MGVFHDSENPLLGLFPTEMHIYIYIFTKRDTRLFRAAMLTKTTSCKQPKDQQ